MILPATSATKGADNEDGCAITVRVTLVTVISQTFPDFGFSEVTVVTLKSKTFIGRGFFKKYTLERVMEMTVTTVTPCAAEGKNERKMRVNESK